MSAEQNKALIRRLYQTQEDVGSPRRLLLQ